MRRRAPFAERARECRRRARAEARADLARRTRRPCGTRRRATRACGSRRPTTRLAGARNEPEIEDLGGERGQRHHAAYHTAFARALAAPRSRSVQTSRRDIFLLACCQALLLTNASGLISMNGLVGYLAGADEGAGDVRRDDVRARLGARDDADVAVDGRVGRRARIHGRRARSTSSAARSARSRCRSRSFPLFCVATGIIGIYNAVGLQYRFAAAEVAAPADRAKAISLVLAGGVVGGLIGPQIGAHRARSVPDAVPGLVRRARRCSRWSRSPCSRASTCRRRRTTSAPAGPAAVARSSRQPAFIVAVLAGALGYGLMNLLMTATPIAMNFCGHPFSAMALGHRMARRRDVRAGLRHRLADPRASACCAIIGAALALIGDGGRRRARRQFGRAFRRGARRWSASAGTSCTPAARRC